MERNVEIKPGLNVSLSVNVDMLKETTDIRNAVIYDIIEKDIILSQTNPPIAKYMIGKNIDVTYVIKDIAGKKRLGFSGKVLSIISNYNLSANQTVPAVIVKRETGVKPFDLRMHYRVKPKSNSGLDLYWAEEKVSLIDISVGGARFCHARTRMIEYGQKLELTLVIDDESFNVPAKALKVWNQPSAGKISDLEYVSIQFLSLDKKCAHLLSGKLLAIQREILAKN